MANEIRNKYRTAVAVQASAAASAGVLSAGTQTVLDNTSSGNGAGCAAATFYLTVTTAPTSQASAELYVETSIDGTNYSEPRVAGVFSAIKTAAADYACDVDSIPRYSKWSWKPIGYAMTAKLDAMPIVPEVQ